MSREQLRKANHSLIERRRREKINFALGELRGMVPGLGAEEGGGGKAGEFKLEVSWRRRYSDAALLYLPPFFQSPQRLSAFGSARSQHRSSNAPLSTCANSRPISPN